VPLVQLHGSSVRGYGLHATRPELDLTGVTAWYW
jgi:hypothetical protein